MEPSVEHIWPADGGKAGGSAVGDDHVILRIRTVADQNSAVGAPAYDEADVGGIGEQSDVAGEGVGPV